MLNYKNFDRMHSTVLKRLFMVSDLIKIPFKYCFFRIRCIERSLVESPFSMAMLKNNYMYFFQTPILFQCTWFLLIVMYSSCNNEPVLTYTKNSQILKRKKILILYYSWTELLYIFFLTTINIGSRSQVGLNKHIWNTCPF